MSIRDRLPSGKPVSVIKQISQDARELKAYQRLGQDSVVTYRIFSSDPYDISIPAGSTVRTVNVQFMPDDMTFGGAFCYRCYLAQTTANFTTTEPMKRLVATDGTQQWTYSLMVTEVENYKFYFFTTGSGTFTVNLV